MQIEEVLKEIRDSYYLNGKIYTEGSCFRLYSIFKAVGVDVKPHYSELDCHWIMEIDGKFYDINGEVRKSYVEERKYRLITDENILKSAYIPTYGGQSVRYDKYGR